jgi:hypothetical protein
MALIDSLLNKLTRSPCRTALNSGALAGRGYAVVGAALLSVERIQFYQTIQFRTALDEFRSLTTTVTVEILESYLEDLLDKSVSEECLFIKRNRQLSAFNVAQGCVIATAILSAIVLGSDFLSDKIFLDFSPALLWLWVATLLLVAYVMIPYLRLGRRICFARIVSREIARRRGIDKTISRPHALVEEIIGGGVPSGSLRAINAIAC